jgi:hypothetical protein
MQPFVLYGISVVRRRSQEQPTFNNVTPHEAKS